jgi:ABC-type branched-subunit amino acid transport system substrate-binding protein
VTTVSIQADINARMKARCGAIPATQTLISNGSAGVLPFLEGLLNKLPSNSSTNTVLSLNTIGANLVSFLKTGLSLGVYKKYLATFTTLSAFASIATAAAPDVPPVYAVGDYAFNAYKSAANTSFISAWRAAHGGTPPNGQELDGYREMNAFAAAIRKAHSDAPAAVRKALEGLTFSDPTGSITINAKTHQGSIAMAVFEYVGRTVKGIELIPASQVPQQVG